MMEKHSLFNCDKCKDKFECADTLIHEKNGVYGIIVHDGGSSFIEIKFCPWCGEVLATNPLWSQKLYSILQRVRLFLQSIKI